MDHKSFLIQLQSRLGKDKGEIDSYMSAFLQILKDELSAWAIDAETNELIFFGKWLRSSIEKESFYFFNLLKFEFL